MTLPSDTSEVSLHHIFQLALISFIFLYIFINIARNRKNCMSDGMKYSSVILKYTKVDVRLNTIHSLKCLTSEFKKIKHLRD